MLHASTRDEAQRAARGLRSVGFLELAGYVDQPSAATSGSSRSTIDELERLLDGRASQVIDVREKDERDEGYIPGSRTSRTACRARRTDGVDTASGRS